MNGQYIRSMYIRWEQISNTSYIRKIPALAGLDTLEFRSGLTCFTGENGTGKSTLLEAVAVAFGFNPEGGSRNFQFSTRDTHSELWQAVSLVKGCRQPKDSFFLRAESYYNVASQVDDYANDVPETAERFLKGYGGLSLHAQSHGESVLALVQNRFRGNGVYLLDEPETGLSPQRQLILLTELMRLQ